jgi:hypothetical protein
VGEEVSPAGLSGEQAEGLGIAFNEATLLGVEVDTPSARAAITLRLLTLPESGPPADDTRVSVLLSGVSRVLASQRNGRWDDASAAVVPFRIESLLEVVHGFGHLPIYGGQFIDQPPADRQQWADRLSCEWRGPGRGHHSITLSQDGPDRHLDLWIEFATMALRSPDGNPLAIDDVIAGGRRWWDGLHAGDARTHGHGIFPGRPPGASGS